MKEEEEVHIPEWDILNPAYFWVQYNLTVVGDRYLSNGRRQHLVLESVPENTVIADADIFSVK